ARHPHHRRGGNVVGARRLAKKLGKVAVSGGSVEMVAEVLAELTARVGDTRRPVPRLRIQHDVRRFEAGSRQHYRLGVDLDLLLGVAIDISYSLGLTVLVTQHVLDDGVGPQFQPARLLRVRNGEPSGREKGS